MRLLIGVCVFLPALATAATVPIEPTPAAQVTSERAAPLPPVNVRLEVIRHGYSCQNLITDCTTLCIAAAGVMDDPILSNYGVNGSQRAGVSYAAHNNAPDLVMSSTLMRAMETAIFMFPNATNVYQAPYVKEFFVLPGETPKSVNQQNELLIEYDGVAMAGRMNYTYVNQTSDGGDECSLLSSDPRCKVDWSKFIDWLAFTLVASPPVEVVEKINAGKPITVTLVTHSKFMEKDIIVDGDVAPDVHTGHVLNNQGYYANFILKRDVATPTLERAEGSLWSNLAGTPGIPSLCADGANAGGEANYARCEQRFPSIFSSVKTVCGTL